MADGLDDNQAQGAPKKMETNVDNDNDKVLVIVGSRYADWWRSGG